jgi:hypothetical protein
MYPYSRSGRRQAADPEPSTDSPTRRQLEAPAPRDRAYLAAIPRSPKRPDLDEFEVELADNCPQGALPAWLALGCPGAPRAVERLGSARGETARCRRRFLRAYRAGAPTELLAHTAIDHLKAEQRELVVLRRLLAGAALHHRRVVRSRLRTAPRLRLRGTALASARRGRSVRRRTRRCNRTGDSGDVDEPDDEPEPPICGGERRRP